MNELTVVIVDDEPASRTRLRNLIRDERDVRIVAEAGSGLDAVEAIETHQPSVVFLDVQMPEIDGFEVLRRLDPAALPLIIFVTAFDRYAVEAFEVRALDYLVKPVRRNRFAAALQRARETVETRSSRDWNERSLSVLDDKPRRVNRILVHIRERILWVAAEEIDWIESAGNYARVHTGGSAHLIRETMSTIEERLDPTRFVRVHRSAIVNIERVREVIPVARGEYDLLLADGVTHVSLSRRHRSRLEFLLGQL